MRKNLLFLLTVLCAVLTVTAEHVPGSGVYEGYLGETSDGTFTYHYYDDPDLGKISTLAGFSEEMFSYNAGAIGDPASMLMAVLDSPTKTFNGEEFTIYGVEANAFNDERIGCQIQLLLQSSSIVEIGENALCKFASWSNFDFPETLKAVGSNAFPWSPDMFLIVHMRALFPPKNCGGNEIPMGEFIIPGGSREVYSVEWGQCPLTPEGDTYRSGDFEYICSYYDYGEERLEFFMLAGYVGESGNVTVPSEVSVGEKTYPVYFIAENAFNENTHAIETITLGETIVGIFENAFNGFAPSKLVFAAGSTPIYVHPQFCNTPLPSVEINRDWTGAEEGTSIIMSDTEYDLHIGYWNTNGYWLGNNYVSAHTFCDDQKALKVPIYHVAIDGSYETSYAHIVLDYYLNRENGMYYFDDGQPRHDYDQSCYSPNSDLKEKIGEIDFTSTTLISSIVIGPEVTSLPEGALSSCYSIICKNEALFDKAASLTPVVLSVPDAFYTQAIVPKLVAGWDCGLFLPESAIDPSKMTLFADGTDKYFALNGQTAALLSTDGNSIINRVRHDGSTLTVTAIGGGAFAGKNITSLDIPSQIEHIGSYAFRDAKSLESVNIPENLKSIGYFAFQNTSVSEVALPQSLKVLREGAFFQSKLKTLELPVKITDVPAELCSDCSELESVVMLPRVANIGENAFAKCPSLKKVAVYADVPPVCPVNAFENDTYGAATLVVPMEKVNDYQNADTWYKFNNIEGIDLSEIELPGDDDEEEDGLSAIADDRTLPVEVYTVGGVKVNPENALPGLYIVKQGRTVRKMVIR